jgi:hypothetical protein
MIRAATDVGGTFTDLVERLRHRGTAARTVDGVELSLSSAPGVDSSRPVL